MMSVAIRVRAAHVCDDVPECLVLEQGDQRTDGVRQAITVMYMPAVVQSHRVSVNG